MVLRYIPILMGATYLSGCNGSNLVKVVPQEGIDTLVEVPVDQYETNVDDLVEIQILIRLGKYDEADDYISNVLEEKVITGILYCEKVENSSLPSGEVKDEVYERVDDVIDQIYNHLDKVAEPVEEESQGIQVHREDHLLYD